jgi:hypothetical protein
VVVREPGDAEVGEEVIAADFGEFLLQRVRDQLV